MKSPVNRQTLKVQQLPKDTKLSFNVGQGKRTDTEMGVTFIRNLL